VTLLAVLTLAVGVAGQTSTLPADAQDEAPDPALQADVSLAEASGQRFPYAPSALPRDPARAFVETAATVAAEEQERAAAEKSADDVQRDPRTRDLDLPALELPPLDPVASGPSAVAGIPARVLEAYQLGALTWGSTCGVSWALLAGIGKVESNHASDGLVYPDGRTVQEILGPVLNGDGFAAIRDTDQGRLDGDTIWDRAVGPMQFIPSTWAYVGVDADGDGTADPHDIDDAAASAARYLCLGNRDLREAEGLRRALLSYNQSSVYVDTVLTWARSYAAP
jgi:membrane-bound lytic murein transglycosylase B